MAEFAEIARSMQQLEIQICAANVWQIFPKHDQAAIFSRKSFEAGCCTAICTNHHAFHQTSDPRKLVVFLGSQKMQSRFWNFHNLALHVRPAL